MRRATVGTALSLLAVLLSPAPRLFAQDVDALSGADPVPARPDSANATQDSRRPDRVPESGLKLGWSRVPFIWSTHLGVVEGRARDRLPAPGEDVGSWLAGQQVHLDRVLAARADTLWWASNRLDKMPADFDWRRFLERGGGLSGQPGDAAGARAADRRSVSILPDALGRYADLRLEVDGTGQIASLWQTFAPCTIGTGQQCNSGAAPRISPEFQIRAFAEGTITERFHVNVDFDQTREFNATNDISVFYEGKSGEIIEWGELGQVTLPLPASRFISRGIPAGNFGVRGDARFGPLKLRGVLAEQEGNVLDRKLTLDVGGAEPGVLQDFETVLDDAAYQSGQFFFIVDPREIQGYPFIDVLTLEGAEVPDSLRPTSSIKLYRHEISQRQNVEAGVIQARAVAVRPENADPALPDSAIFQGFFRPLVEGEDFIVHRSGLWAVVRARVQRDEALAVTYIAERGDTIGDFNAEEIFRDIANTGQGELPRLSLLKDATTHRPGGVTWEREMHQVYRVTSSEGIQEGSVELIISQGPLESGPIVRTFEGEQYNFLEIFGVDDQPRDDLLDGVRVWRPGTAGEFAGSTVLTGSYLVFPALEPFKDPPPIKSTRNPGLTGEPFPLADGDRNLAIYDQENDQTRISAYLYRLNFRYRAVSSGSRSSFSLGALGIREGSGRVLLDGNELTEGEDYTIDYDIGELRLLRPEELFAGAENPELEVTFEQKALFQVGTRSILGFTGEYSPGPWGSVDFIGLLQKEGTVLTRPELGLEPSGIALGGVVTRLDFGSAALDRFANSLPGVSTDRQSRVLFTGELAASDPTTNRTGTTWVDDFEGESGLRIGLTSRAWRFGSVVSRPDVAGDYLPAVPDLANQLSTVWQSQWDDNGIVQGPLLISQIDPQLNVLTAGQQETVLWITLDGPPAGGENGWFSITNVLSESGIDLTTSEFLEFYASTLDESDESLALIVDIGTVSEDALVGDSLGIPSGVNVLDQEADPVVGVWGNQDDTGLWDTGCSSQPDATAFPLGDPRANCTNNNGLEDSEDLNRDNFLNTDESFFRYIVPLTVPSRFLNRPTGGEFRFNLYRIPLRLPDHMENATGQGQQNVRHIRITLTSRVPARVLLSRMKFSGTPWLKRAGTGSVSGTIGETPGTAAQVSVGPISTVDRGYVSPPGLSDQEADKTDELRLSGAAINEQSLRLAFSDVPVGERIEVFRRFTERPRDFLRYRQLRAWTLPFAGEWGEASVLRFFIRLGFDSDNFYLYRIPLREAVGPAPSREDWLPEDLLDFNRFIELRAEAERRINETGSNLPGDTTFVLWDVDVSADGDSTYALVINDRSRAPNLAAIRELALGIENIGDVAAGEGEVWIGDLRVDKAADDGGLAGLARLSLDLADVLSIGGDFTSQNPFYTQLDGSPSFQASWQLATHATLQLGSLLPAAWGVALPIGYARDQNSDDPFFLPQTDVLAKEIPNLRTGGSSASRWNVSLAKRTRSGSPILRSTVDGMRVGYSRRSARSTATQAESETSGWRGTLSWSRPVVDKSFRLLPGFLRGAIDLLPSFLSESVLLSNLKDLRFRWTPRQLRLGADLSRSTTERRRFQTSITGSGEESVTPTVDRQHILQPGAGVELQPFPSLVLGWDFSSSRDLVPPRFRVQGQQARSILKDASSTFLGVDVGWETARNVRSRISWQPSLASWLDTRFRVQTAYVSTRNASYVQEVAGDTVLLRDLAKNREVDLGFDVDPTAFLTAFGVPERVEASGFFAGLRQLWDRIAPVRLDWRRTVNASWDRRDLQPDLGDYLVLEGFDHLRVLKGDTAVAAGSNRRWSVRGGYRFPLSLEADVDYEVTETNNLTTRTERGRKTIEWPAVRVTWRRVPVPSGLRGAISSVSLTGGWVERERLTSSGTGQDDANRATDRSAGVTLVLTNGLNLSYRYENAVTNHSDATGASQSTRGSHSARATGTVSPPGFLSFARSPMRLSLEYSRNGNFDCRELGGSGSGQPGFGDPGEDCSAHVDQTTQNAAFTLDTDFTGYSVGVQFSWVRRASAVGRQQTSNQYNLNIFGRFYFRSDEALPSGP